MTIDEYKPELRTRSAGLLLLVGKQETLEERSPVVIPERRVVLHNLQSFSSSFGFGIDIDA